MSRKSNKPPGAKRFPEIRPRQAGKKRDWKGLRVPGICVGLVVAVLVAFGGTVGFGYLALDDDVNVYGNPQVMAGFSLKGVGWAFMHPLVGRWSPLATISQMMDCSVYGDWAGGHHLTNVLLHALGAVLLFLAMRRLTGAVWRSGFVAGIFAVHPLRAEVVAFVSSRGVLLCGVFFMLTLMSHARYARTGRGRYYWMTLFLYAAGLMSHPMMIALPSVLLLLDWWPLECVGREGLGMRKACLEKTPMLVLAGLCVAVAVWANRDPRQQSAPLPFLYQLGNGMVSYVIYISPLSSGDVCVEPRSSPRSALPPNPPKCCAR
jgi:hypothetical protein